jgi:hypothetical protein
MLSPHLELQLPFVFSLFVCSRDFIQHHVGLPDIQVARRASAA